MLDPTFRVTCDDCGEDIETDAIDEMVEKIVEREYERSRDRLKGQTGHGFPFVVEAAERTHELMIEEADAMIRFEKETVQCADCGVRRPAMVGRTDTSEGLRCECFGECREETRHDGTDEPWEPVRFEFECPECGYETVMWESPPEFAGSPELPECPECPPPPEGPDGIPVIPTEGVSVEDVEGAVDARDALDELSDIAGVNDRRAMALISAGYFSREDLRRASLEDLAEIDGWGRALAARVKGDVGDAGITKLILTEVRLEADAED